MCSGRNFVAVGDEIDDDQCAKHPEENQCGENGADTPTCRWERSLFLISQLHRFSKSIIFLEKALQIVAENH